MDLSYTEMYNPFVSSERTTGFMQGSWKDGGQLQTGFSHDSKEVTGLKLYVATGNMAGNFTFMSIKMSTLNVDNINEYTTDGKVNVGHDIKLASGKSIRNSDNKAICTLVHLNTTTVASGSACFKHLVYKVYLVLLIQIIKS